MVWTHALFRDGPVPQLILDGSGRVVMANPAAQELVGRWTLTGLDLADLVDEPGRPVVENFLGELCGVSAGVRRQGGPVTIGWNGSRRTVELVGSRSLDAGEQSMLTISLHEVVASPDPDTDRLTGIPGRARGLAALTSALRPDATGCLLVVDLDGFEDLNAHFGNGAGDLVLSEAARRLRAAVPPGTHVARIDGDAFLVVAPGVPIGEVGPLAARLLGAMVAPVLVGQTPMVVTASIGAAPLTARSADAALGAALRALSVAKDRGGGQLVVDAPHSHARGRRRADLLAALQDSEEETAAARAEARTDPLTGLPNRRRLDEDRAALQHQARASGQWVAAAYLDLDEFGTVNKVHGDAHGDRVLTEVGQIMAAQLRAEDRVYRKGGEEFVLLLSDTDSQGAVLVAERLREAIESARIAHGGTADRAFVTATLGVAADRGPALDLLRVVARAELAMRQAKRAGRNQVAAAPPADERTSG